MPSLVEVVLPLLSKKTLVALSTVLALTLGGVAGAWTHKVDRAVDSAAITGKEVASLSQRLNRLEAEQYKFLHYFYQQIGEFKEAKRAHDLWLEAQKRVDEDDRR